MSGVVVRYSNCRLGYSLQPSDWQRSNKYYSRPRAIVQLSLTCTCYSNDIMKLLRPRAVFKVLLRCILPDSEEYETFPYVLRNPERSSRGSRR